MRTLYISRHGDAEYSYNTDIARCLTSDGEQEAAWLGDFLLKQQAAVDIVFTSPAQRALTTSQIVINKLGLPAEKLEVIPKLYNASLPGLLEFIRSQGQRYPHILLVAHNPGLSDLVNYLSDEDIGSLPTCGICGIELDLDNWDALQQGSGKLRLISYPGIQT